MPTQPDNSLAQLAQLAQLFGGNDQQAALQQHAQMQWLQMQQAQQQHAAEQSFRQQQLQQSIAHDTWMQQHALAQETNADRRAQLAQEMEQDRAQIGLFHGAMQGGVPYAKALQFLPERMQQSLLKQHQTEIAQNLPSAQNIVAGLYNSTEPWKRDTDPNTLAMAALASAGLRPQDYLDKIDYSKMNPYAGYTAATTVGAKPRLGQRIASAVKSSPSSVWGLLDRGMYNTSQFLHDVIPGATPFDTTYDENKAMVSTPISRDALDEMTKTLQTEFAARHQNDPTLPVQNWQRSQPSSKIPTETLQRIFGDRPIPLHW